MVQIDITKISSKGQVVIPSHMRKDLREGDSLLIIKDRETIMLKKASELDEKFKEDLEFARRTEEAYRRHEKGDFKEMEFDEFLKELDKW